MKKLTLIFALSYTTLLSAQTFTLNINSLKKNVKTNQVNYLEVVSNPDEQGTEFPINVVRKINVQDSTCTFYQFGVYVSTVKLISFLETESTYEFKMLDYDNNNDAVITYITLTKDLKHSYYYWYNQIQNVTKVEINTDFTVNID